MELINIMDGKINIVYGFKTRGLGASYTCHVGLPIFPFWGHWKQVVTFTLIIEMAPFKMFKRKDVMDFSFFFFQKMSWNGSKIVENLNLNIDNPLRIT